MENWTIKKIAELKELNCKCKNEIALSGYTGCMIRLINGFSQIYQSQFHYYEKKILWHAMELFANHFMEQTELAVSQTNVYEKRCLIDEIENAVDRMTNVYRNVIDSTSDSDRQMLSGVSVDTSIYELSPKLCAFYSKILDDLVHMFHEENNYAFILHPTLKNNTETQILFEQRTLSGKVVIIYISESIIEEVDVVSVFLLHEAFHVLTKERLREKRLPFFSTLLISSMKQLLFKDVDFSVEQNTNGFTAADDVKFKEQLLAKFFSDMPDEAAKWDQKSKDSKYMKDFYGNNVLKWGTDYLNKRLLVINAHLENWMNEVVWDTDPQMNYRDFNSKYLNVMDSINKIRSNLFEIIYNHKTLSLNERFLFIFREIYADIACILTLELEPDEYDLAFEKSKQFVYDPKKFRDSIQELRDYIVSKTVARFLPPKIGRLWENRNSQMSEYDPDQLTHSNINVMIDLDDEIIYPFLEYAFQCARAFCDRIKNTDMITAFRAYMDKIRTTERITLLTRIMTGDFDNI